MLAVVELAGRAALPAPVCDRRRAKPISPTRPWKAGVYAPCSAERPFPDARRTSMLRTTIHVDASEHLPVRAPQLPGRQLRLQ